MALKLIFFLFELMLFGCMASYGVGVVTIGQLEKSDPRLPKILNAASNVYRGLYLITLLLMYKVFFQLSRVAVEMNPKFDTPKKIFRELWKLIFMERLNIVMYFAFSIVFAIFYHDFIMDNGADITLSAVNIATRAIFLLMNILLLA